MVFLFDEVLYYIMDVLCCSYVAFCWVQNLFEARPCFASDPSMKTIIIVRWSPLDSQNGNNRLPGPIGSRVMVVLWYVVFYYIKNGLCSAEWHFLGVSRPAMAQ